MVPSSRVMEMTEIQAKKVSSFYISRGMIPEKDREIYDYCFDVLISTASTTAVILGISIAAGTVLRTLSYMAVFGMLKSSVGGYHARTHTGCLVRTVGTYAVYLALSLLLPAGVMRMLTVLLTGFAAAAVFRLAPVGTANKPLGEAQTIRLRRQSRILIGILAAVNLILLAAGADPQYAFAMSSGMTIVAGSLIIGWKQMKETESSGNEGANN